jgi:protein-disulfide isomerase
MTRSVVSVPTTRRERRAAERAADAAAKARPHGRRGPAGWSVTTLTIAAVIVALVSIGGLWVLQQRGHEPVGPVGSRTAAGIVVPTVTAPAGLAHDRSLGSATAPVTLTVWSDFQCPACRAFSTTVEPSLIGAYVATGKLRIDYRDLLIIGPESHAAAVAARCAAAQDRFWPYHDILFANQAAENSGAFTAGRLAAMADAAGLDRLAFDACVADPATASAVDAETAVGRTRGQSTPTLDFGSVVIAGSPPYADLAARIDGLIAAAAASK